MAKRQLKGLEQYAAKSVLVLSGSLLVLSVAINNIGFKPIIDAYAQSIVMNLENEKSCNIPSVINKRLEALEEVAHKSNSKGEE